MNAIQEWLRKRLLLVIGALALILVTGVGVAACTSESTNAAIGDNNVSNSILQHYDTVQPILQPTGQSVYRATLTYAEATHILGLNTYSFFMRKGGNGSPFFQCPSEGAAVPNTAELDNPLLLIPSTDPGQPDSTAATVGNMDPDGVYPPSSSQGTYVRCLLGNGSSYLVYSEPDVLQINANKASWDPSLYGGQGGIVVNGSAVTAMPVCQVRYVNETVNTNASAGPVTQKVPVTNCTAAPGTTSGNGK
jgi:hypothetical protein